MVNPEQISSFAREIAQRYAPDKIVLFGSQAWNTATDDSDVDMLVIMDFEGRGAHKAADILCDINPRFSCDLLVRRASEVQQRLIMNDDFMHEILTKGKTLYDRSEQRMA
jgi:predicted nucleotidyltransferase